MSWIELHVAVSNSPILVSTDAIIRVGIIEGEEKGTSIHQADGSTVVVSESYEFLKSLVPRFEKD